MEIGIVGLPHSGKTTIFNALTKGNAATSSYSNKPNVGVVKVPDERLDVLASIYNPRRVVAADVTYTDIPPPQEGLGETKGIGGEYLTALQSADALLIVVRAFQDPSVIHIYETIDPIRDTENILMEISFSDIEILDRRTARIIESSKSAKSDERESLKREQDLIDRVKEDVTNGIPIIDQSLSYDETKRISGFGFLTTKPIIVVMNVGEDQLQNKDTMERQLSSAFSWKHMRTAVICAQLEMDLSQMNVEEEKEFRENFSTGESSLNQMIKVSYDVVGQISFFTVGEDEVRAWEIPSNTPAQQAAGKIHSDLERGFIRAEVISCENLIHHGSLNEAKKHGVLRQEGKNYIVKDGEIMHVLFNV